MAKQDLKEKSISETSANTDESFETSTQEMTIVPNESISNQGEHKSEIEVIIPDDGKQNCKDVTEKKTNSIAQNNQGKIKKSSVTDSDSYVAKRLDEKVNLDNARIAYESEQGYREIAKTVVGIADNYLDTQQKKKSPLRESFSENFTKLLFIQLASIIVFVLLDSFSFIPFDMSESLLTTYIISVFVETLGAIAAMIAFAFTSKEESDIVGILTTVIQNFQKYKNPDNKEQNTENDNKNNSKSNNK